MRVWLIAVVFSGAVFVPAASAQTTPWRFRWEAGQVLSYRVKDDTSVAEVLGGGKVATSSRSTLVKRWRVAAVDAQGVATLELSLASMRTEQTRPDGEVLLFDSADPGKSTPALATALAKYVGQTLAQIKVDTSGKVMEVVKGSASSFESEPPFLVTLPPADASGGQPWECTCKITLEPPQGTGEQYEGSRKYQCRKVDGGRAVLDVTTMVKNPPASKMDQAPLLPRQQQGEIVFDVDTGRLYSAQLRVDRELKDHQGAGSSYHFRSETTVEYLDNH